MPKIHADRGPTNAALDDEQAAEPAAVAEPEAVEPEAAEPAAVEQAPAPRKRARKAA